MDNLPRMNAALRRSGNSENKSAQPLAGLQPVSVDEVVRRHSPFSFRLDLEQLQGAFIAASCDEAIAVHAQFAGLELHPGLGRLRLPHVQVLPAKCGERARPWLEA